MSALLKTTWGHHRDSEQSGIMTRFYRSTLNMLTTSVMNTYISLDFITTNQ